MKRFFVKLLIFFCGVFLGLVSVIVLLPLPPNAYNLSILDKHRLIEAAASPRLVLVGGSNCAFGIDSAALSEALHIPVVNLGVNAGFGLGRMLDDASPFLNPGDILVIIPEYEHFTSGWNGAAAAYELIFDARQYRLLWGPGRYGLPQGFPSYLGTHLKGLTARFRPPDPAAYRRDGLNGHGDYVGHLELEDRAFEPRAPLDPLDREALGRFFRMAEEFQRRGIRVLLSYPCYEAVSFDRSRGLIDELDGLLRGNERLRVISRPEAYRFPRDLFYDTVYHLNARGRTLRTETLRRDLEGTGVFR